MNPQDYKDPVHFKAIGKPKCPNQSCQSTDLKVSLSEHLFGPCNGQYEVVYCAGCLTFLSAHPIAIMNVMKGIPEDEKVAYPGS
mgnify:CR=1 FL=1